MRIVTDSQGREWVLRLDMAAWERVVARGLLSNSLDTQAQDLQRLVADPAQQARLAYWIVRDQAHERGYTSEQVFVEQMPLEDLGLLCDAALDELHHFFACLRMRFQAHVIAMTRELLDQQIVELTARLQASPGSAPGSQESTRDLIVSQSS